MSKSSDFLNPQEFERSTQFNVDIICFWTQIEFFKNSVRNTFMNGHQNHAVIDDDESDQCHWTSALLGFASRWGWDLNLYFLTIQQCDRIVHCFSVWMRITEVEINSPCFSKNDILLIQGCDCANAINFLKIKPILLFVPEEPISSLDSDL
jgi:hypothetical protein